VAAIIRYHDLIHAEGAGLLEELGPMVENVEDGPYL
jgi:hypothetical protein